MYVLVTYSKCPELEKPTGVAEIFCDEATCTQICDPGYISIAQRRTKCRYNKKKGHFWRRQLSGCATCETELTPPSGVTKRCAIDKNGINNCKLTCDSGKDFILGNKTPKLISVKCKCPRDKKTKVCFLIQKIFIYSYFILLGPNLRVDQPQTRRLS